MDDQGLTSLISHERVKMMQNLLPTQNELRSESLSSPTMQGAPTAVHR
jgi:hypothetical protein